MNTKETPKTGHVSLPPGQSARTQPGPVRAALKYRWEHVAHESLTLVGPWGIVWRLNFGANLTKPFFHPLQTADGRCLTQASPKDHPWHYGLWHSWKTIERVNYWEEDRKTGRADGTTRIVEATVPRLDAAGAHVRLRLAYFPAEKPDAVVMDDTVELTIEVPREDGSYRINWEQTSRARRPIMLDRTPPPGQPEGKDYGGYAGLSFRGDRFMSEVAAVTSTGRQDLAANRLPAKWAALSGTIDGRRAGIAMFDHPANLRHPTPWYFVLRPGKGNAPNSPFWYFNAALLHDAPLQLTPDRPLALRYLVRVDCQAPSPAALDDEFRAFAQAPATQIPVSPAP